ncbi:hypothetical protein CRYUN_Cryun05aG0107800 [Craigia yunnanensis]
MKRVFGIKKDKEPPPSIEDASDRINKRGDSVDEKLKKLDSELSRYKEQIKKTRPGPAQEAIKARAMRVLKQKRMYEGQRDMLYNQTFNLDQVAFASEGLKDAQQTRPEGHNSGQFRRSFFGSLIGIGFTRNFKSCFLPVQMSTLKSANKELKGMMKTEDSRRRCRYNVPDDIDEDELIGDMGSEADGVPSYLQPEKEEPDLDAELNLPSAPTGNTTAPAGRSNAQGEDEFGLPTVP